MSRFNLEQIGQWLELEESCPPLPIRSFQYDSRQVREGDLFFALPGAKVDGHAFLTEVAEKKALGAVVLEEFTGEAPGLFLLRVKDVKEALQHLARGALQIQKPKVVAITGSVGKTTTKEYISALLQGKIFFAKTPGSINSQVGLPSFLLNCSGKEELLVLEMGMNHPGEIQKLISIAPPDLVVITQVGLAHTEFFPQGILGVAQAKAEILSHPKTSFGVIHSVAFAFDVIRNTGNFPKVTYSLEKTEGADYTLRAAEDEVEMIHKGSSLGKFSLPMKASHLQENFLAAVVVCLHLGMSVNEIAEKTASLKTCAHRFELLEKKGITFLNDSYNANPLSMRAALLNLPKPQGKGKVIAVLGEMRELGVFSKESHVEVGGVALLQVDHLLCLGQGCLPMVELFHSSQKPAELFLSLKEMQQRLSTLAQKGDVVLLKGSNSHQLWKLLGEELL